MKRQPKKRKGAPTGNQNACRHNAYLSGYGDGRTRFGKWRREIEAELVQALGGKLSPQQILLVQRVTTKAIRCRLLEEELLKQVDVSVETEKRYLRLARELRQDLKLLGLDEQPAPTESLTDYLKEKAEK